MFVFTLIRSIKFHLLRLVFIFRSSQDRKYVVVGEKGGETANDNPYAYFLHCLSNNCTDTFYVVARNCKLPDALRSKKYVIRRNSFRHMWLYLNAKALLVGDGYSDVSPDVPRILKYCDAPFFHLRHGITGFKKHNYNAQHYGGRILRFCVTAPFEKDIACYRMMHRQVENEIGSIRESLLAHGIETGSLADKRDIAAFVARFSSSSIPPDLPAEDIVTIGRGVQRLKRLHDQIGFPPARVPYAGMARFKRLLALSQNTKVEQILMFLTWRDDEFQALPSAEQTELSALVALATNAELIAHLRKAGLKLAIALHAKSTLSAEALQSFAGDIVRIIPRDAELQSEIARSAALITDYSSVCWDFALLDRPVYFLWVAKDKYMKLRGSYIEDKSLWCGEVFEKVEALVAALTSAPPQKRATQTIFSRQIAELGPQAIAASAENIRQLVITLPPSVTFVTYNIYGIGGTVRAVSTFANYLYEKGYYVRIISLFRTEDNPKLGLNPAIPIRTVWDKRRSALRTLQTRRPLVNFATGILARVPSILTPRHDITHERLSLLTDLLLIRALRRCQTDIAIPTSAGLSLVTVKFRRAKTKVLVQENEHLDAYAPEMRREVINAYRRADGMTTLTASDRVDFQNAGIENVHHIGNCTGDNRNGRDVPESRQVIALARLIPIKQIDLLIRAFHMTRRAHPDWQLRVYGDGSEKESLKALIQEFGLGDSVRLMGSVADTSQILRRCDIVAVPSLYEGFGLTILEAYGAAKPVVLFDIDRGPKEIVVDGVTGLKARPYDVEDFANKLAALMGDAGLRDRLGNAGYELFQQKFTTAVVGARLEQAIASVMHSESARDQAAGRNSVSEHAAMPQSLEG